jgi:hypothetical protein
VLFTRTDFINQPDPPAGYRVGVTCQTRTFEVTGVLPTGPRGCFLPVDFAPILADLSAPLAPGVFVGFDQAAPAGGPAKRLLEWERNYFRADAAAADLDLADTRGSRLPLGQMERLALPYETLRAAFPDSLAASLYGVTAAGARRVDANLLRRAGYLEEADAPGYWWAPSERAAFDPSGFYHLVKTRDGFGNVSTFVFDSYWLALTASTDPAGSRTEALHDYRVLQVRQVTSVNGNRALAAFDVFGRLVATALQGKAGEGDSLDGFVPDLTSAELDAFLADPRGQAPMLLGKASTRIVYDPGRYLRTRTADGTSG